MVTTSTAPPADLSSSEAETYGPLSPFATVRTATGRLRDSFRKYCTSPATSTTSCRITGVSLGNIEPSETTWRPCPPLRCPDLLCRPDTSRFMVSSISCVRLWGRVPNRIAPSNRTPMTSGIPLSVRLAVQVAASLLDHHASACTRATSSARQGHGTGRPDSLAEGMTLPSQPGDAGPRFGTVRWMAWDSDAPTPGTLGSKALCRVTCRRPVCGYL